MPFGIDLRPFSYLVILFQKWEFTTRILYFKVSRFLMLDLAKVTHVCIEQLLDVAKPLKSLDLKDQLKVTNNFKYIEWLWINELTSEEEDGYMSTLLKFWYQTLMRALDLCQKIVCASQEDQSGLKYDTVLARMVNFLAIDNIPSVWMPSSKSIMKSRNQAYCLLFSHH